MTDTSAPSPTRIPHGITRFMVIRAMARFPSGALVSQIARAVLQRKPTQRQMQCIYTLLAREVAKGLIHADGGKGAHRRLTEAGRELALELEAQVREPQPAPRRRAAAPPAPNFERVNGVFDYARKVALSLRSQA